MAASAGASPLARKLIRRQHVKLPVGGEGKESREERLLRALQAADEER